MKIVREKQTLYMCVRSISLFFSNPFFLLAISSFSPIAKVEKDAKYHIKRQNIGIFDFEFPNLQGLGVVIDDSRLIYTDVFEFIERIYTILKDNFIVNKSKQ